MPPAHFCFEIRETRNHLHTYVYIYIYVYASVCIYVYIYTYVYICICVSLSRTEQAMVGVVAQPLQVNLANEDIWGPLCPLSAIFGTCFPRCKEEPVLYAGARSTDPTTSCERGVFAEQCVFQEWRWAEVTDAVVQSRAFVSLDLSLRFGPDCRRRPPVLKIAVSAYAFHSVTHSFMMRVAVAASGA